MLFRLINKHFALGDKFHKISNRSTSKLKYSCMTNLKSLINSHNQNILRLTSTYRKTQQLFKEKIVQGVVYVLLKVLYDATIASDKGNYARLYKGICETIFKKRYANHKSLLTFQLTKAILNFLPNFGPLKQSSLTKKYYGKSEEDESSTIPFSEVVTCA